MGVILVIIFLIVFIWLLIPQRRQTRFRRHSPWGSGPIILHDWDNDDDDRRGGGGGFGGGGGGGFSGGGGSFGGGGASGSW
jgi:uncharacterized protein